MDLISHYCRLLDRRPNNAATSIESTKRAGEPDLSPAAIRARVTLVAEDLHRIVDKHLDDDKKLHRLADRVANTGTKALRLLAAGEEGRLLAEPRMLAALEAIVRTDGSRPSFIIKNGRVDLTSSPAGDWTDAVVRSGDMLRRTIACVGRIDDPSSPQGFQGTGTLVGDDLIVTNRHVLQAVATRKGTNEWVFNSKVAIDFGHEFRGRKSVTPRKLKKVIFVGPTRINERVVHSRLDLALIQLERAKPDGRPRDVLAVDVSPDWDEVDQRVYIIGYPGRPAVKAYEPPLLERLFQSTFGCKRIAPGEVMKSNVKLGELATAHDATTLGGNSGSVVVVLGREFQAAGLHYGGRSTDPRENWCHVYGRIQDRAGEGGKTILSEALKKAGVIVHDRQID